MNKIKIVADSSANIMGSQVTEFDFAPMKIITKDREFVDDISLDVKGMVEYFNTYKEKSQTSCPNTEDWLRAFGDAQRIICVTITSGLSGSYNSACVARDIYEAENPQRKVFVIDSLSAGPELQLIIEKAEEFISDGMEYEDVCKKLSEYTKQTGLLFTLESLNNFAANGRVSPAIAKITGFLGIRVVGKASDKGQLEPLNKCRGEEKALSAICNHLSETGLRKGKVRIAHCDNLKVATEIKNRIIANFPTTDVEITECRGLCSYYAEKGGMLVAFEKM